MTEMRLTEPMECKVGLSTSLPKKLKASKRSALPPFMALEGLRKASELADQGHDIIHLEIGQPSSPAPQQVNQACIQALNDIASHGYSQAFGVASLRQRIALHYDDWYGCPLPIDNIAVTPGSSIAFAIAFLSAFDQGERIAIPTPGYPAYRNLMIGLGLEPILLPAGSDEGWKPLLAEMEGWDELPDGLIITNPSNPTGTVLNASELEDICRWCDKHGVRLISDEIYHGLVYGGRAETALNYTKNAIIINSMSKYFSMTGWRIGWMILPDELVIAGEKLIQNLLISAPTPNQLAAIAAFDCTAELEIHRRRYEMNRNIFLEKLPKALLDGAAPCSGAFYLYVNMSVYGSDSTDFADALLAKQGVATTPGVDFDKENGQHYLRLSFAGSTEDMHEAAARITQFTSNYRPMPI